ncbi:MAG: hypothetical protein IPH32_09965 [Bacteroidetes bacterium]|nr:hypothetical protein [Bacteroidota bacterium]
MYAKLLYGEGSNLSISANGNTESVSSITLDDVKAYYKNFSGFNSVLAVSGRY